VDADDLGMGMGGVDHDRVSHVRKGNVVDIAAAAGNEAGVLGAPHRLSHPELAHVSTPKTPPRAGRTVEYGAIFPVPAPFGNPGPGCAIKPLAVNDLLTLSLNTSSRGIQARRRRPGRDDIKKEIRL